MNNKMKSILTQLSLVLVLLSIGNVYDVLLNDNSTSVREKRIYVFYFPNSYQNYIYATHEDVEKIKNDMGVYGE